jgi:hypothetical protein
MAGAQGMMGAGPALIGDPALIAAAPAFAGPFEQGFAGGMPDGFVAPTMAIGVDGTLGSASYNGGCNDAGAWWSSYGQSRDDAARCDGMWT